MSWQLIARQIGFHDYFRVADDTGVIAWQLEEAT
jgi:hypothetical protein